MIPYESVLDLIGNTPLVDVSRLSPNPNVRIIAKLENQNPFGSVKDRIAKSMIEDAEKHGRLLPGQTIVEPSSGNTGIALAAIAQIKGYPIKILMPTSVSIERRQMLDIFGAEVILTPGEEGSNGAVARAIEMAKQNPDWCFLYQYANDANARAHYEGTGPEISPVSRSLLLSHHSVRALKGYAILMRATFRRCLTTGTVLTFLIASVLFVRVSQLSGLVASCVSAAFSLAFQRVPLLLAQPRWLARLKKARLFSSCATVVGSICRLAPTPTTSMRPKLAPKRSFISKNRDFFPSPHNYCGLSRFIHEVPL